jgi:hypothetical protein
MGVFKLNPKGGEEVLKVTAAAAVKALTERIGAQAGPDAVVDTYVTDRAAGSVAVPAHQQAKDGVLTRAAAAAGLEVRPKR